MAKSIIIIGAGMGGMSAGIYGQMNGYETQIFETHTKPGGQCTSWKRKGYTFDPCIHHFFGCRSGSSVKPDVARARCIATGPGEDRSVHGRCVAGWQDVCRLL